MISIEWRRINRPFLKTVYALLYISLAGCSKGSESMSFDVIAAGGRQRAYQGEKAGTDLTKLFDPQTSLRNRIRSPILRADYGWTLQIAMPQHESGSGHLLQT